MTQMAHLSWALLSITMALWSLSLVPGRIDRPAPLAALTACGLAGLFYALVTGAPAG